MTARDPNDRASRLERLLLEHSFPERRSPQLLAGIWELLEDGLAQGALAVGSTPDEIRRAIGPPSLRRGDEGDASFDWGYPRPAPAGQPLGDDWYLFLRFQDGRLRALASRIWREGR
jgi:hypothetical protein